MREEARLPLEMPRPIEEEKKKKSDKKKSRVILLDISPDSENEIKI